MKKDNRGVSLIEIIVAITILAICAAPLFRSMIFSTELNSRSRTLLAATNAAEAVMENLKADGMEQFISKNQGGGQIEEVRYLDEDHREAGYSFVYPEYSMDQKNFRVQVEVKPYENKEDAENDYNAKEVADIQRMNRSTDAIFVEDGKTAEREFVKAVARGEFEPEQRDEVLSHLNIRYDYEIFADGETQRVEQTAGYFYNGMQLGENLTLLYDSDQSRGTLYNLYIFIQPGIKNVITIQNQEDYPLEVCLVKQGKERLDLEVELHGTSLLQNLGEERDPDFTKGIRLRTNFRDSGDQITYSYIQRGTRWDHLPETELQRYFDMKYLYDENIRFRLYDVTVTVMEGEREITSLTGTVTR